MILLATAILVLLAQSCVQKAYKKTVRYRLVTPTGKSIKVVSIRGSDKPLSWNADLALRPIIADSVYEVDVTYVTGYNFTEVKFLVDGEFELKDQSNRPVQFGASDTTLYTATFNQLP